MVRSYLDLTKFGIVSFVLYTGAASYLIAQPFHIPLQSAHFWLFMASMYFLSSGIFALNQYQERHLDAKMERTSKRPLPSKQWNEISVLAMSLSFVLIGLVGSYFVHFWCFFYGFMTALLYNVCYTLYWKRHWVFGAVPGAIPGAMPVAVGFGAQGVSYSRDFIYLFVLMFLWQMPHFWALAIKYKDDYRKAGFPVLPTALGAERALYHVGLYVFAYAAWAVMAPWFISVWVGYVVVILPFVAKVVWEFLRFYKEQNKGTWLSFFLWTTFSVLIFMTIPVFDRWGEMLVNRV